MLIFLHVRKPSVYGSCASQVEQAQAAHHDSFLHLLFMYMVRTTAITALLSPHRKMASIQQHSSAGCQIQLSCDQMFWPPYMQLCKHSGKIHHRMRSICIYQQVADCINCRVLFTMAYTAPTLLFFACKTLVHNISSPWESFAI